MQVSSPIRFVFRSCRPWAALAVFILLCSSQTLLAAQTASTQFNPPCLTQDKQSRGDLEPDVPVEKGLVGGQSDSYCIQVEAGQFLHVIVEQLGIDVVLTLYAPDGKPIASMDSPNGNIGLEQISTVAEMRGTYGLVIASGDAKAPPGRYRVSISPLRMSTEMDRKRIVAERAFAQASQLGAQEDPDSLRKAAQAYETALPIWHALGDAYEESLSLYSLGMTAATLGDRDKGLNYLREAVRAATASGDKTMEAVTLSYAGAMCLTQGKTREALDYLLQELTVATAVGERNWQASASNNIGSAYSRLGEKQKALEYFEKALAIDRELSDSNDEASALDNIGQVYDDQGDRIRAREYFNKALVLHQSAHDRHGEAVDLNNLGLVSNHVGEKAKALDFYTRALAIYRGIGDETESATTLSNIGKVYDDLGQKQTALDFYTQSLELDRKVGNRFHESVALNNIAGIYDDLGEKQKGIEYYQQALTLDRIVGNRFGEATTLDNIANLFADLGDNPKAFESYQQALRLRRNLGDRSGEARTLGSIGARYFDLGQLTLALDFYQQALVLHRAVGDRLGEGRILADIGNVYIEMKEVQKALAYFEEALPINRDVGDRAGEAATLNDIGGVYFKLDENQKALERYGEALALATQVQDPLKQASVLGHLMGVFRKQHQPAAAAFFGKQAVNKLQEIRANIRGFEKTTQQDFLKSKEKAYRDLADVLIIQGRLPEAEQVLDLLKNEEYFEFIRRDDKDAASLTAPVKFANREESVDRDYEANASRVTAIGNEWAVLHSKPSRTPDEQKHLAELAEQLKSADDAWQKFLTDLYADRGKSKEAQTTVENLQESASGMQHVLRQLGPGVVALYTLVGDDVYRVIVVTPTVMVARAYPIKAADLRKKVFEFRRSLTNPSSDPVPDAQELYRILVGPVAQDLDGAKAETLMWSLDDVLRYLPIAALHDGHEYVVEKYKNEVFTPASSLTDQPDMKTFRGLGLGVSKSYGDFSPLPSVPEELRRIIRDSSTSDPNGVLPGQTMLDESFTEDSMKKALEQNFPIVHIASHFAFAPGNETKSFLLLGGTDPQGEHLSLAEIRKDPGFTFAETVLLTLSACDTAVGGAEGDGRELDGLGRLAQQKGAKAVMATLWSVSDRSTGLLMQEFYRYWTTTVGTPKAEALRQAQLDLLRGQLKPGGAIQDKADSDGKKRIADARGVATVGTTARASYAHPYYWAPFILIGNWR